MPGGAVCTLPLWRRNVGGVRKASPRLRRLMNGAQGESRTWNGGRGESAVWHPPIAKTPHLLPHIRLRLSLLNAAGWRASGIAPKTLAT